MPIRIGFIYFRRTVVLRFLKIEFCPLNAERCHPADGIRTIGALQYVISIVSWCKQTRNILKEVA